MGKVIGLISIKGGVGKTTIASSLAVDLVNHHNKKVLLVDANFSAPNVGLHMNIPKPDKTIHDILAGHARLSHGIHNSYGVDVIPGSYIYEKQINVLKLQHKINKLKDKYDFVVIDSSPSLNEEMLATILAAESLFIVTTPDLPTLTCSLKAAKTVKERNKNISGIIINKIRDPKFELSLDEIQDTTEIPVVARIPDDINSTRALFTQIPIPIYKRNSPFSKEINNLSLSISGKQEKQSFINWLLGLNFRKEQVNRQVLKEELYKPFFK